MKYLLSLIMLFSSLYSYNFSIWQVNNLNKKDLLYSNNQSRQFFNGYVIRKDFNIIYGFKNKDFFTYLNKRDYDKKIIKNQKFYYGIFGKKNIIEDISYEFYKDDLWTYSPLIIYIPTYNLYILNIYIDYNKEKEELIDLPFVINYYKKLGYKKLIVTGNFQNDYYYLKKYSNLPIYLPNIRCTFKHSNKGNKVCNVLSDEKLKVQIDKSIVEKSFLSDLDFKTYISNFYPIYIKGK